MRRTKIICTLGPASEKPETLRQLVHEGANVFRLNMSHAQHDWVREIVPRIRAIAEELGCAVAILMDTQGPAIRTGDLKTDLHLKPGDILEFTVRGAKSEEAYSVDVNYDGLINDINEGDTVLVDNGVIHLLVLEKRENRIRCKVITPGTLGSRRHINLPGVRVNLPPLTQKDLGDIALGVEMNVDFIALSFVRQRSDLEELRELLAQKRSKAQVMAKIEDQSAVRLIHEIIAAADAIMVARGDLGIEMPIEELPIIQRKIVKLCARLGKPVVVATHMLESMIHNPLPTRAEITDVANAVFEQADAIMLSGETSVGDYPVECVRILNRVALRIERSGGAGYAKAAVLEDVRQKTVASAVVLANSLSRAKSSSLPGMARWLAMLRICVRNTPPFLPSPQVRKCDANSSLCWGVYPVRIKFTDDPNATIELRRNICAMRDLTSPGDNLVIISDLRAGDTLVDTVQLRTAR